MKKRKCQIHAKTPITCFSVPILGITQLNLTTDEIYKCLCSRAEVKEFLPNGKTRNLDLNNYNKLVEDETPVVIKEEPVVLPVQEEITLETEEPIEEEIIEVEEKTIEEEVAELLMEESPVKTHEVPSRNKPYNKKNKKNKR